MILQHYLRVQLGIPLLLILSPYATLAKASSSNLVAKPGCQDRCGNVIIPYPFGIASPDCFYSPWFNITCNTSQSHHPKPFLTKLKVEVLEIKHTQKSLRVNIKPHWLFCEDQQKYDRITRFNTTGSPFRYSTSENMFVMHGCPGSMFLTNDNYSALAGCSTVCAADIFAEDTTTMSDCTGIGCCQTPIPNLQRPLQSYHLLFRYLNDTSFDNGTSLPCYTSTIMESTSVKRFGTKNVSGLSAYPSVLQYPIDKHFNFSPNSNCSATGVEGCQCNSGYEGNPYLPNGCQVAEACEGCKGHCARTESDSYSCESSPTSQGIVKGYILILGFSIGGGFIILVICCYLLYHVVMRRREKKLKAKHFKRNGGILLEQQLSSNQFALERTKVFTINELDKATDHFNQNRILGEGGQGTVYKGMLTDGTIVAIKKSKLVDESQVEQFINEVVILSQINHRNVVKLLGCCLETEVPLLVYEFILNGTLAQHIHEPDEDFYINWEMRLKIVAESAGAIAYLHSSSSTPIYHRDIKSANILLDDKNRAKVSDFGSSKTIAIDQTHSTTLVQGTIGYLDPEYFQSNQLTEKSDVYSFGVVLLELLTSRKPIIRVKSMEKKSLVSEFLYLMDNSRMFEILDPRIVKQAKDEELIAVADLARQCLSLNGKSRPTMKEVAMILEMIIKSPALLNQQAFPWKEVVQLGVTQTEDVNNGAFFEKLHDETSHITTTNHLVQSRTFFTASIDGTSSVVDAQPLLRDTI